MKSEVVNSFMAQFVFGVDTLHQKEVFSAVRYLMLMVLTRISMSTFVSFQIIVRCWFYIFYGW